MMLLSWERSLQTDEHARQVAGVYSSGVYVVRWYKKIRDQLRNKRCHIVTNEGFRLAASFHVIVLAKQVSVEHLFAIPVDLGLQVHPQKAAASGSRGVLTLQRNAESTAEVT
jgi:hypothetical protein